MKLPSRGHWLEASLMPSPATWYRNRPDPEGVSDLEVRNKFGAAHALEPKDPRARPRFKLAVDIRVYPRECPVVRGHTVDISECGISAILPLEIPVGEVIRLEFTLPFGEIAVHAMVRQRNAFRYGFQFVIDSPAQDVIARTCNQLAVQESVRGRHPN
jgi:hypothetical protein